MDWWDQVKWKYRQPANLKILFTWSFNWKNQIYDKCKNFNASISMHGSHAKTLHILYARQFFLPPFDMSSQHKYEQVF